MSEDCSRKRITVILDERDTRILAELTEWYHAESYSEVIRAALHNMHYRMLENRKYQIVQERGNVGKI